MSDIVERLTAAKNQGIDSYFCEVNEIEALLDDAIAEIIRLRKGEMRIELSIGEMIIIGLAIGSLIWLMGGGVLWI